MSAHACTQTRRLGRALACASLAAVFALTSAPVPAFARRLATDQVGGTPLSAGTVAWSSAPDMETASGILVSEDGRVLWGRSAGTRRAIASTTKMMTALLVLEHGGLGDTVVVSKTAAATKYSVGLRAGEKISVRRLLELTLVASSNDAAYALGEHVGGTMPRFVSMMNTRARQLGLASTHFMNPHGLDRDGHYSTAADLYTLSKAVRRNDEFRRIVRLRSVVLPARTGRPKRVFKATNELLGVYSGIDGVKTGFTDWAKYCFVSHASRDGVGFTGVVLGTTSNSARFAQTRRLLDWGYRHYRRRQIASSAQTVGSVPIAGDTTRTVPVRFGQSVTKYVFDLDGPVSSETSLPASLPLPVYAGQRVGTVTIEQRARVLAVVPAVATTSVASVGEIVGAVPVTDYLDRTVAARAVMGVPVEPFDATRPVQRHLVLEPRITAPIRKSRVLGEITYTQDGNVIARVPVVADRSVAAPTFVQAVGISFKRSWRTVFGTPKTAQAATR